MKCLAVEQSARGLFAVVPGLDSFHCHLHRLDLPDVAAVIANGTVGGEFAHACNVDDGCSRPGLRIVPERADPPLTFYVCLVICQDQEGVACEQIINEGAKEVCVTAGRGSGGDEVQYLAKDRILLVKIPRPITAGLEVPGLVSGQSEQEEVVGADLITDFDVCAVQSSDGQGTVQRELHITGAGGLLASHRNLLGEVGSGIERLGVLDVVVREEDNLEAVGYGGIIVDDVGDGVYQLYDELCHEITRRGLSAEDEGPCRYVGLGITFQVQVERDDMQYIEVLAFVFVDALGLDVEERRRVHDYATPLRDEPGKPGFCGLFDVAPLLLELRVIGELFEPAEQVQVVEPAITDTVGEQLCKRWVAERHEAPRGDTIGDVVKFFRPHLGEVAHHVLFE